MSEKVAYGFFVDFDRPAAALRPLVEEALKAEGFGILTEIDVRATLKKKLGVDVPAQWILGACNPPFAHRALTAEPDLGLLLPCNVILRELPGGRARVAVMDVSRVMAMVENPAVAEIAREVDAKMRRVLARLNA